MPGGRGCAAARFQFDAGDLGRAEELVQAVLAGSPTAALHARARWLAADLAARRSNFMEATELALAALELAGEDRELRAAIELHLVYCAVSAGDFAGAGAHARTAIGYAEAVGDDGVLADALAVLTMADFLSGRGRPGAARAGARARDAVDGAIVRHAPAGDPGHAAAVDGGARGRPRHAGGDARRGRRARAGGGAPMLSLYVVWAHLWRGELDLASRVAARSSRRRSCSTTRPSGIALAASALVHAHDGSTALARREAGQAIGLFERLQWRSGRSGRCGRSGSPSSRRTTRPACMRCSARWSIRSPAWAPATPC